MLRVYVATRCAEDYRKSENKPPRGSEKFWDDYYRNRECHVVAIAPLNGANYRIPTHRMWNFKFTDGEVIYVVTEGKLNKRSARGRAEGTNCTPDNFEELDGKTISYETLCDAINTIDK